jgi:ATP-dependent Clp protease ATP-binding subunit ClpA
MPAAKTALEAGLDEARELGSRVVEPEHLLLGLRAQRSGTSARILRDNNVDVEACGVRKLSVRLGQIATCREDANSGTHT